MSISDDSASVTEESLLEDVLPAKLAARTLPALTEMGVESAVDLYECVANVGCNWYRNFQGIKREDAVELVNWLAAHAEDLGEVTERFWPGGCAPSDSARNFSDDSPQVLYGNNGTDVATTHISALLAENNQILAALPETLSGAAIEAIPTIRLKPTTISLQCESGCRLGPSIPIRSRNTAKKPNAFCCGALWNAERP